jgi:hypothetical protein
MFIIQKPALIIDDKGLMLRACCMAKWDGNVLRVNPTALAILARPDQRATVEKTIAAWNRGEQTRALIMLVHLGEPAVKTEAEVRAELAKAGFDPDQPRDGDGKWTDEDDDAVAAPSIAQTSPDPAAPEIIIHPNPPASSLADLGDAVWHGLDGAFGVPSAEAQTEDEEPIEENLPEDENRIIPGEQPSRDLQNRISNFKDAYKALVKIDPDNPELQSLAAPGYIPTQANIDDLWNETRDALGVSKDWLVEESDKGDGRIYINPLNLYDRVRIMAGNPSGSLAARQQPYVQDQINRQFLTNSGIRQQNSKDPETHIPIENYDFRRD